MSFRILDRTPNWVRRCLLIFLEMVVKTSAALYIFLICPMKLSLNEAASSRKCCRTWLIGSLWFRWKEKSKKLKNPEKCGNGTLFTLSKECSTSIYSFWRACWPERLYVKVTSFGFDRGKNWDRLYQIHLHHQNYRKTKFWDLT